MPGRKIKTLELLVDFFPSLKINEKIPERENTQSQIDGHNRINRK